MPGEREQRRLGRAVMKGISDDIEDPCGVLAVLASSPEVVLMADISIRNLDDSVRDRLRIRAASHGRSMESEVRAILAEAVREPEQPVGFLQAVFDRFSSLGGVELDLPDRSTPVRGADFSR